METDCKCSPLILICNEIICISSLNKSFHKHAAAKSLQSYPTLCDPIDDSPPRLPRPWDSPGKNTGVGCHFLLQCMKLKSESEVAQCVRLLATPWTTAYQAPPSMGFSKQEYWSGLPLPSPTISWSLLKFTSIESVMPSSHLVMSSPSHPPFSLSQHPDLF